MYYIISSAGRETTKMRLGTVVQKVGRAGSYLPTAAVITLPIIWRTKHLDEAPSEGLIQLGPKQVLGQFCVETITS